MERVGGRRNLSRVGWASNDDLSRLANTANNPNAVGQRARHATSSATPPAQPMDLQEAWNLLRGVVAHWIEEDLANGAASTQALCMKSAHGANWTRAAIGHNGRAMAQSTTDDFARRYFDEWRVLRSGTRPERLAMRDADDRPSDALFEMLHTADEPDRAWPIILTLVAEAPGDEALAFVAAGPLEDLIQKHGDAFADRIVERAQADARFRSALRGVWGWENVSESLRSRVFELLCAPS